MSRARAAGVVLLLVLVAWPATARATEVSSAELQTLAREAQDDPAALDELRAVDVVDGQTVDIAGALSGARGAALDARLAELERSAASGAAQGDPRADAKDVLAQDRFHEKRVPGPFKGLIDRLGGLVPSFGWLDDLLPGGSSVLWIVLAAVLAVVAWLVARRLLSRRVRVAEQEAAAAEAERAADPKLLDRQADDAERAGDLETALRLRFRAGLLRLDRRGAIYFRPSISTREVQRALRSEEFDGLAATFDDVVYGGRAPAPEDIAAAREGWPAVVEGAKR